VWGGGYYKRIMGARFGHVLVLNASRFADPLNMQAGFGNILYENQPAIMAKILGRPTNYNSKLVELPNNKVLSMPEDG
jgi:hypothetical protein